MRRAPTLLAAASVAVALLLPVAPTPAGAIVDGDPAAVGEWPWQVALFQDGAFVCGGALVAVDLVLTAAHCTEGFDADDLSVRAGSLDVDEGEQRDVAVLEQHEEYDPDTARNDVSLLVLAEPFAEGELIRPVAVADAAAMAGLDDGDDVVVTGFGATSEDGDVSDDLLEADVDVVDDAACAEDYAGEELFADTQVCAGIEAGGADACYGDSGGPLVAPAVEGDADAGYVLVGLVSWGDGCGRAGSPTVYTEVAAFTGWLADHGAGVLGGERFASPAGRPMSIPAAGRSAGKADRYPSQVRVEGFEGDVTAVSVELTGLRHERAADLDVWLEAPDGTVVTLLSDVGGDGPVDLDVVVADGGGDSLDTRVAPTDLEPDDQRKDAAPPASLAELEGVDPNGTWRLLVADDATGARGSIDGWALVLA